MEKVMEFKEFEEKWEEVCRDLFEQYHSKEFVCNSEVLEYLYTELDQLQEIHRNNNWGGIPDEEADILSHNNLTLMYHFGEVLQFTMDCSE